MEESLIIERLSLFGLGRQEATIYVCLLKNEPLTGYEVGKITGISRSNVYSTLNSLVEHGAAYILEGTPSRYTAVDINEFCDNRIRYLKSIKNQLSTRDWMKGKSVEGYITIEGFQHICDKIHHMLMNAEIRIYFSAESSFLTRWEEELSVLVDRGNKVVLISNDVSKLFHHNKKLREGVIFYEMLDKSDDKRNQVRLIIDSAFVLTGEISSDAKDTCLYSAQKNFVSVFKDALKNEIELIKIRQEKVYNA